jgi:hypothetical protein
MSKGALSTLPRAAQEKACLVRLRLGNGKEGQDVEDDTFAFEVTGSGQRAIPDSRFFRAFIVLFGFDQFKYLVERSVRFLDRPVQLDNQDGKTNIGKRAPIDCLLLMA